MIKLSSEVGDAREKLRRAESRSESSEEEDGDDTIKDVNKNRGGGNSEDMVERMEEKLEAAQANQKNLFLIIFQVIFLFIVFS